MDTQAAPPPDRTRRVDELRRLVHAGLYPIDPDRLARAIVSRARREAGKQLDSPRPD